MSARFTGRLQQRRYVAQFRVLGVRERQPRWRLLRRKDRHRNRYDQPL
jgi:hypothetical protein